MMADSEFDNYASILSSPLPQFIHDSADAIMRGKIFPETSGAYYWITSICCLLLVVLVAALQLVNRKALGAPPMSSRRSSTSSSASSRKGKGSRRRSSATSSTSGPKVKSKRVVLVDEYGARLETVPVDYIPPPGQEVKRLVSSEEATALLAAGSASRDAPVGSGIMRVETATLASNNPMEDTHSYSFERAPQGGGGWWSYFGVFDGHYGNETSSYLRNNLTTAVHRDLKKLYNTSPNTPSSLEIETTISNSFTDLDDSIIQSARGRSACNMEIDRAVQGSCALLALYDSASSDIRVAVTGDSRAVLGKRIGSSTTRWLPVELSVDQNFHNAAEEKRICAEHPGENIVSNWRIMGELAVSRAFGDARFKWDASPRHPRSLTPPYLTAEPVIKSTKVRPSRGDFLIMASDGLWDTLTNEDAVAIVGRWMDDNSGTRATRSRPRTKLTPDQEEKFAFVDANAGAHLIRNAVGGSKDSRVRRSLSVPPGKDLAKRYRDDMTVIVIFFE